MLLGVVDATAPPALSRLTAFAMRRATEEVPALAAAEG